MTVRSMTLPEPLRALRLSGRSQVIIAVCLFAAVFLTRLPVLLRTVMDHDESLYFLMAEQWRAGHLPYTTIWDNKPLGIYGIFLLFQYAFGDHVWVIRVAAVCFISVTAFAVFKIALTKFTSTACGVFAGVAYVICSLSNDGLAANTEIFMACFTTLAMLCALSAQFYETGPIWRGLICGVLFGLAVMTKYVAVFEAPALAFALLYLNPKALRARLFIPAMIGAVLPLAFAVLLYAGTGHLQEWWSASVASNVRRVGVPITAGVLNYALGLQLSRWLPLFFAGGALAVVAAWQWRQAAQPAQRFQLFLLIWLAGGAVGVASAKSFYDHYFLQILPVLCVSLAWAVIRAARVPRRQFALMALLLAMPAIASVQALVLAAQPIFHVQNGWIGLQADTPARIASDIRHLPAGVPRKVYIFDYQPVIYSLAGLSPPTKYAFPSILTTCFLGKVAGVSGTGEVRRILAAKPEFILRARVSTTDPALRNQAVFTMLDRVLASDYEIWRGYDDAVMYRLRPGMEAVASITPPAVQKTCKGAG